MNDKQKEILKLTEAWYEMVGIDHHKDRDCHWYINEKWSYGEEPIYCVEHYGYIADHYEEEFDTKEEAESGLIKYIKKSIAKEREWANEVLKDGEPNWDEWQVKRAKKIIDMYIKLVSPTPLTH